MSKSTDALLDAIERMDDYDSPYAEEIIAVLSRAWVEAVEQDEEFAEQGKPHLRNFLKVTPLGLAIRDLADKINGDGDPA